MVAENIKPFSIIDTVSDMSDNNMFSSDKTIQKYDYSVFVRCITFNHAEFIKDALDGFCMQQTTFPFICAVFDDASTDGEIEVLNDYLQTNFELDNDSPAIRRESEDYVLQYARHKVNHNCFFVVVFLKYNHWRLKKPKDIYVQEWYKKSKYHAECEGDDYWIDPFKLQKQVDFLNANHQYSAIASNAQYITSDGDSIHPFSNKPSRDIDKMGGLVRERAFHTASIMYRRELREVPFWKNAETTWDTYTWCCLLTLGPIRYEDEITCVYRLGTGVTTTTSKLKWILLQEKWANILYQTFSPQYITYNDAYRPLLQDAFSVISDKSTSDEDRAQLRNIFKKYITPSLLLEKIPMMLRHYASRMKSIIIHIKKKEMIRHYINAILNRFYLLFVVFRERYAFFFMHEPEVMSSDETIKYIVENKCSVSRNGDGEIYLMRGERIDFQEYNPLLSDLMKQALTESNEKYLPCIINVFHKDYNPSAYYKNHLRHYRYYWYKFTNPKVKYGCAGITRFYSKKANADRAKHTVNLLRRIWDKRDILIIEGEMSRLGVGNDLFDNVKSIRRILAPSINAFSRYDEIKQAAKRNSSRETLILLALGPTATALAYELYKDGYWAIDIGHIDICYEWYIRGLERGDNIPGKYTNESVGEKLTGDIPQEAFQIYEKQIIERIL